LTIFNTLLSSKLSRGNVKHILFQQNQGIKRIEGNNYLDLDTLTTMFFLRTHGPTYNYQYKWRINRANCLIILLNPVITNPEVVENFLYVGTNPQVHNDGDGGGDEEKVGTHLHHEPKAGGNYNDERWAWMQTEVQGISTEQQRQGVEIFRLRNEVQRSNRLNDENNQMLQMMMQHLHLQGPPYGPQ